MVTRFPINDLRTLVARALQGGGYSPAEMRGRTALYQTQHVMRLVAIKRLQAADQTLSDVRLRLVGLTSKQLAKLADLPSDHCESAQRYRASRAKEASEPAAEPTVAANALLLLSQHAEEIREFWNQPAALPHSIPLATHVSPALSDLEVIAENSSADFQRVPIRDEFGFSITESHRTLSKLVAR